MKIHTTTLGIPGLFELVVEVLNLGRMEEPLARVALVLQGKRLGGADFFGVQDILGHLEQIVSHAGNREHCEIFAMPADIAFHGLSRVLLGEGGNDESFAGTEQLERFKLWFHSTLGDCWLLMVSCEGVARILYTPMEGAPIQEVLVPDVVVDSALVEAVAHLLNIQSTQ